MRHINTEIPGQVSEIQLNAIAGIANKMPPGVDIVEVGSLFGRSSWTWSMNSNPTTQVFCIDPWEGNEGIHATAKNLGIKYSKEQFLEFTKNCKNIKAIQGYSPDVASEWSTPIGVYYEDAVHENPILKRNLTFWSKFVDDKGIVCGDDYRPRFPDVVSEVNALRKKRGAELFVVEFFWCLLPLENRTNYQQDIALELNALKDKYLESLASKKNAHTIELLELPEKIGSTAFDCKVKLTNDSGRDWSKSDVSKLMLAVHLEPVDHKAPAPQIVAPLEWVEFKYDVARSFKLRLDFKNNAPGLYKPTVRLVDLDGKSLGPGRRGCNQSQVTLV